MNDIKESGTIEGTILLEATTPGMIVLKIEKTTRVVFTDDDLAVFNPDDTSEVLLNLDCVKYVEKFKVKKVR